MDERVKAHSNIMMLELVIVIGFFAVISTFLMKMFVAADEAQKDAKNISEATILAETVLEKLSAGEELGFDAVTEGSKKAMVAYYDKEWKRSDTSSRYEVKVYESDEEVAAGVLRSYEVVVTKELQEAGDMGEEILSLSTKKYLREGDGQ